MLLVSIAIFLLAVTIHEYSHGWVANRLGDPTARLSGRLTLNPLAHIDPIGSVALPLLLIITGSPIVFGWAKPVPVDARNLRNPKEDMIWVGLAGPGANFLAATAFALLVRIGFVHSIIVLFIIINLILAFFNLIPIPPLDGSRIVSGLLPYQYAYQYSRIEPFGIIILFILLASGVFGGLILPMALTLASLLTGLDHLTMGML